MSPTLRLVVVSLVFALALGATACSRNDPAPATRRDRGAEPATVAPTSPTPPPADAAPDLAPAWLRQQAAPMLDAADDLTRTGFASQHTPPHRQGMFRAALAWAYRAPLTPTERSLQVARLYTLGAPQPLAVPVARALLQPLAEGTVEPSADRARALVASLAEPTPGAPRAADDAPPTVARVEPIVTPILPPSTTTTIEPLELCPPQGCAEAERRAARIPPRIEPAPDPRRIEEARRRDLATLLAEHVRFAEEAPTLRVPPTLDASGAWILEPAPRLALHVPLEWVPERLVTPELAAELLVPRLEPEREQLAFDRLRISRPWRPSAAPAHEAHAHVAAALCGASADERGSDTSSARWRWSAPDGGCQARTVCSAGALSLCADGAGHYVTVSASGDDGEARIERLLASSDGAP